MKKFRTGLLFILMLTMVIICALGTLMHHSKRSGTMLGRSGFTMVNQTPDKQPSVVSAAQFESALQTASSRAYFQNMGESDLNARQAGNTREYRARYVKSLIPHPSPDKIRLLFDLAKRADVLCLGHIDAVLAALPSIPWKFAILQDGVEGGMPHTHADVVCLPSSFIDRLSANADADALLRTLIHEKIHVLQRARQDLSEAAITAAGYKRVCERAEIHKWMLDRVRSNPDLDRFIYSRPGRCATVSLLADSDDPTHPMSLSETTLECGVPTLSADREQPDSSYNDGSGTDGVPDRYEHPNEMMAYTLSELVVPMGPR